MDETAEPVAAASLAGGRSLLLVAHERSEFEGTMWPLAVVVVGVNAEHAFEVAAVEGSIASRDTPCARF
jgi:hypothetical protein